MSLSITISNRHIGFLATFVAILLVIGISGAYQSGSNPAVFGHSPEEMGVPDCAPGQVLTQNRGVFSCVGLPTNKVVYLDEEERVKLYETYGCGDGTNNVWLPYNVSSYVPADATKAILRVQCGQNAISLRPGGSSLKEGTFQTQAIWAGNDDGMMYLAVVSLDSSKVFEAYSSCTQSTRYAQIVLYGYIIE